MSVIKNLIENHGYVTNSDLVALAQEFPNLPLVIKWGCAPRSIHLAKDVAQVIKEKTNEIEYAREVFISANQLDSMKAALGMNF
jgi:hypothetical protein